MRLRDFEERILHPMQVICVDKRRGDFCRPTAPRRFFKYKSLYSRGQNGSSAARLYGRYSRLVRPTTESDSVPFDLYINCWRTD